MAYMQYANGWGGSIRNITVEAGASAHDWLAVLAKAGYLNDSRIVAWEFDPLVRQYQNASAAAGFSDSYSAIFLGTAAEVWLSIT
jgi:hypothetical protein